jgi:hypothetical protein
MSSIAITATPPTTPPTIGPTGVDELLDEGVFVANAVLDEDALEAVDEGTKATN